MRGLTLSFRRFLPQLSTAIAVLLALLLVQPAVAEDRSIDPEIEKILRERLGVLQEAATLQREAYRSGTVGFSSTLAAEKAVLEAELELATSGPDRVRIREQMLKNAETLEKTAEELVRSAEAPRGDLLSARANRLRAQADLLIERKAAAR